MRSGRKTKNERQRTLRFLLTRPHQGITSVIPSIQKKVAKGAFYFHATDDPAEVRKTFFEFIKSIDCSFEAVVAEDSKK